MKRIEVLRNFIEGCYYQTIWDDFDFDEDIWKDYFGQLKGDELDMYKELILSIVNEEESSEFLIELKDILENSMIGISFDSTIEIHDWAKRLNLFFKTFV